jgi:hypothetical protein
VWRKETVVSDAGVIVPLAVFFAVGLTAAYLVWRVVLVGGQLRREAQSQRAAIQIAHDADESMSELASLVDEVRRHKIEPEEAQPTLRIFADAMRRFSMEVSALGPGDSPPAFAVGLMAEIDRGERAIELIEHGTQMLAGVGIERHGEGQTEVKRGYLNLLHAREAIRACAAEIAALSDDGADATNWRRPGR